MNRSKLLKFIGIPLVIVIVVSVFFITKSESNNIKACKGEVAGYLTQPSTAEWQSMKESEELASDTMIDMGGGKIVKDTTAIVEGSVKSQNKFGAMLTTNFKCSRPVWQDSWDVETWEDGTSAP